MSFVRNIENSKVDQSLVKHIVRSAKELGLKTCIEGVETASISQFLRKHNATYYQGYYYSKPVEIDRFEQLLVV